MIWQLLCTKMHIPIVQEADGFSGRPTLIADLSIRGVWQPRTVVSVDGVLGHDAQHLMKRLCDQIATKWEKSHSEVMEWVHARMAFAILRATNLCLRGSRVKWRSGHGMA